jgi:hypothetical protein
VSTTLANLRAKLNGEIGVATDGETSPWSATVRNNAISDGYAALWRNGVWKAVKQDYPTVDGQTVYATCTARRLNRLELLDSSSNVVSRPEGFLEADGSGTTQLILRSGCASGYTLRVYGWTAYLSTFAGDSTPDDLDAEFNRVPLLKAKAILYRQQLALFVRYGERQAVAPEMNATVDQLLGLVAAAEREFTDECKALANLRPRVGQMRSL